MYTYAIKALIEVQLGSQELLGHSQNFNWAYSSSEGVLEALTKFTAAFQQFTELLLSFHKLLRLSQSFDCVYSSF